MAGSAVDARTRAAVLRGPAIIGAAFVAALALLYVRDPHEAGSYGFCPFNLVLSVPCPGCGGLRAVNHLTHGRVVEALSSNVLAVALVVGFAAMWLVWVTRRVRSGRAIAFAEPAPWVMWTFLAVVLLFGVMRNTPLGSWFAP